MKVYKHLLLTIFLLVINAIISHATKNAPVLANSLKYMSHLTNDVLDILECNTPYQPGPIDCDHILFEGNKKSGVYRIWPLNWKTDGSFEVYCDMETDGGGWTVIQRRGNYGQPKDYFFKPWIDYQMGFGKLDEDLWLGNDRIFSLTNQGNYSLRIDMQDKEGEKRYAYYENFWIESERQLYRLHISGFSGDAGDSLTYANGMRFTAKDREGESVAKQCPMLYKGAWWYRQCHLSNLNGLYHDGDHESYADGINWQTWKGYHYSLPFVEMKIRPV